MAAVVLNSGGANACTGPQGFQDTHATAELAAEVLTGLGRETGAGQVAVASTGLIGVLLPMDKLLPGIGKAAAELSPYGGEKAAIAIKTTDTVHKTAVATGPGNEKERLALLESHRADVLAKLAEIQENLKIIDHKIDVYRGSLAAGEADLLWAPVSPR